MCGWSLFLNHQHGRVLGRFATTRGTVKEVRGTALGDRDGPKQQQFCQSPNGSGTRPRSPHHRGAATRGFRWSLISWRSVLVGSGWRRQSGRWNWQGKSEP